MRSLASPSPVLLVVSSLVLVAVGCGGDDAPADDAGGTDAARTECADDSECSDGAFCTGTERCNPDSPAANAFGCLPGAAPCLASQTCDDDADRCVSDCGTARDADGDGAMSIDCGGDDCDDADPDRYPGNAEVCDEDAHDEDCDSGTFGDRDVDGDGVVDAVCCNVNSLGDRSCGTDCDDTNPSVHRSASEVCDGLDNDCDEAVDEGFECAPGASRACTVCSRVGEGMQTCEASVCAWGACTADEGCNACDDDNDGAIDEDFMCIRGASTACTNACGTELMGTCSSTCDGVDSCVATGEVCNYCDDDGDGTYDDELPLASTASLARLNCMGTALPPVFNSVEVTLADATCHVYPGTNQRRANVLDTAARADSGAMHYAVPMGYGRLLARISGRWSNGAAAGSSGGWAVVLIASGRLTLTTTGVGYDRAAVTRGLAVEWRWNGNLADRVTIVRLNGTSTGTVLDTVAPDPTLNYGGSSTRFQTLWIEYLPAVMGRGLDPNAFRISQCGNCDLSESSVLRTFNTTSLMGELRPGDTVTVAAVAAESSSVTTGGFEIGVDGTTRLLSHLSQDQLCDPWL